VVGRRGEPAYDVVELDLVSLAQADRVEVGQALDLRLQNRPDRCDDHPDRAGRVVGGVHQAAQHGEPAADGVRARRQPLVRERLPRGVGLDRLGIDQTADRGHQVVGLAGGRGDRQDHLRLAGPVVLGERGGQERPKRARSGQVESGCAGTIERLGHRGLGRDDRGECVERHA